MISLATNYANFPAAVLKAGNIEKGEEMEGLYMIRTPFP